MRAASALAGRGAVAHVLQGVCGDAAALPVFYHACNFLLRLPLLLLITVAFLHGTKVRPKTFRADRSHGHESSVSGCGAPRHQARGETERYRAMGTGLGLGGVLGVREIQVLPVALQIPELLLQ